MFKLARLTTNGTGPFTALLLDDRTFALADLLPLAKGKPTLNGIPCTGNETIDDLLADWSSAFELLSGLAERAVSEVPKHIDLSASRPDKVGIDTPIRRPSKILCAAANYKGHVKEMRESQYGGAIDTKRDFMGEKARTRPYLFFKAPSAIIGPYDDIRLPEDGENVDWEIELGVVIGRRSRHVAAAQASEIVAGYLVTNDLSCRSLLWRDDRQSIRSDWLASKSHDTFCPLGPYFVPRAFMPDHNDLVLRLRLNGEIMQDGNTAEMIFSPDEQIEYASKMMTLEPGDLFLTGTIAGVGQGRGCFLKAGDIIESEIPGLGSQRNHVI